MSFKTSLAVFKSFIVKQESDGGEMDASRVISSECYRVWLRIKSEPANEQTARKFHRTLLNHISSVDGRLPFDLEEERAVLRVIRVKQRWPCFPGNVQYGSAGFRAKGYHEKLIESTGAVTGQRSLSCTTAAFIETDNNDFVNKFALSVLNLVSFFPVFNVAAWVHLGNLLRFTMFARTKVCSVHAPSQEYINRLCETTSQHYAGDMVVVLDMTAKDYSTGMVVAQNQLSKEFLGNLQVVTQYEAPIHVADVFQVITAMGNAFHNPGIDFGMQAVRFSTQFNGQVPLNATYCFDEESFLLIFRARNAL